MATEIENYIKGWLKRNGFTSNYGSNIFQNVYYKLYWKIHYNSDGISLWKGTKRKIILKTKNQTLDKIKYIHKIFKDKMEGKF